MNVFKNPNLLSDDLNNDFSYIVNPFIEDGIKIITKVQKTLLEQIDNDIEVNELIKLSGYTEEEVLNFIRVFENKNILNYSGEFSYIPISRSIKGVNLWIHTTDHCNLKCSYCYICTKESKQTMDKNTIESLMQSILFSVKKHNLRKVTLRLSGGEPILFINKRINSLLSLKGELELMGCKMNIVFLSNGTLLNYENIEKIKSIDGNVSISLDGINNSHNKSRMYLNNSGSFSDVLEGINKLTNSGITPGINTVITNNNIDSLPELTKLLISKNTPFRFSIVKGEPLDYKNTIIKLHECYNIIEKAVKSGYQFINKHRFCDLNLLNPRENICGSGINNGAIYSDGSISFCQLTLGDNNREYNINHEKDLLEMITNTGKSIKNDTSLSDDCEICKYKYICSGGCPLELEGGKSPHCNVFKEIIPRLFRIGAEERLFTILQHKKNEEI